MSENNTNASSHLTVWRRAGLVAVAGSLFGFGAALWFGTASQQLQTEPRWVQVENGASHSPASAKAKAGSLPLKRVTDSAAGTGSAVPAEIERLKTRNRRLEALVEVLKKRAHEKEQPPPTVQR